MRRRDFLKAAGLGAGAAAAACAPEPARRLPLLVRDPATVLGREEWKASLCRACGGGCGVQVRVVSPGRAVKIEGNPAHPVSEGGVCARGLTSLETLYHPDRALTPLRRAGDHLVPCEWDDALTLLFRRLRAADPKRIAVLAGRIRGTELALVDRLLDGLGAPRAGDDSPFHPFAWQEAVRRMTGYPRLPYVDLANASYALVFGADLIAAGPSPVHDAGLISRFHQGRPGRRGKLVVISSRFSLTAARADEWLACAPASEGVVAAAIGHVLLRDGLVSAPFLERSTTGLAELRDQLAARTPAWAATVSGVPAPAIERVAREAAAEHGVAIGGGSAAAHTGSLAAMMAVLTVDVLLASFGPGGLLLPDFPEPRDAPPPVLASRLTSDPPPEVVIALPGADPVPLRPELAPVLGSSFVVAMTHFIDRTAAIADLVLPATHPLEQWLDEVPDPLPGRPFATIAPPVLAPRGRARPVGDVFLALDRKLRPDPLPDTTLEATIAARWQATTASADGVWLGPLAGAPEHFATPSGRIELGPVCEQLALLEVSVGAERAHPYPLVLEVFPTISAAAPEDLRRPHLGELRDPLAGGAWLGWAEIDPTTAAGAGITDQGTAVIESEHGSGRFLVRVVPWAAPGTVALAARQGDDGVEPLALTTRAVVAGVGARAWASTRARIRRA